MTRIGIELLTRLVVHRIAAEDSHKIHAAKSGRHGDARVGELRGVDPDHVPDAQVRRKALLGHPNIADKRRVRLNVRISELRISPEGAEEIVEVQLNSSRPYPKCGILGIV